MNVLDDIVATTRKDVGRRSAEVGLAELVAAGERRLQTRDGAVRDFGGALAAPGLSVIAEHKRSSPSAGVIREGIELEEVVVAYERAGARALSVLTETSRFAGDLTDLAAARAATSLPILRKDFIVTGYQVHEALAAGADAILLIVAALEPRPLAVLHALATELGLATLVEVHNHDELAIAAELGARIIGINNRNLGTLVVDVETTYALLANVPADATVVAESGFRSRAQLERLSEAGIDAVLIGESLMRADDIEAACRALTGVGA